MSSRRIGNYQTTEYIGGGGFGSVFKAEDVNTPGRIVAIKELHKKHTRNPIIKQRFFQEAVAMARLDHPNLPRLFTFGEDNGCYYLVMEFISGKTLRDELHDNGPARPELALSIVSQLLEALSYAHHNGIIHRDLKPDNIILVDESGSLKIKVLDFGIARMVGGENLTLAGEGFGTPTYMSPERMMGESGDDLRVDIYAAGIILYEMLAGKAPFESSASNPVIYWSEMRELHEGAPLPSLASLGVQDEIERIIKRATAKRLEDRYASADEMLIDVKQAMSDGDSAATLVIPQADTNRARLAMTIMPGGADVYVDDELRGSADAIRGKILIEGLAPGLHSVRVIKAGYSEYKINVALEEGHQTDLQVALSARMTAAMPPVEKTAAANFDTLKFQDSDDVQTALLMVESLPVGSTIYLGSSPVAQADADGRATLKLAPGAHEVTVAAPSGMTAVRTITITSEDNGSLKKITIPIVDAVKTTAMPVSEQPAPSAAKKGMAIGASIVLVIALLAGGYFAFRGPSRNDTSSTASTSTASTSTVPTSTEQAAVAPSALTSPSSAEVEAKKIAEDLQKAQSDAEKVRLEKKLAEAEKKLNEEKKAAENKPATPEPPAPAPVVTPEPPAPAENQGNNACLMVAVAGPEGAMLGRFRINVTEQPGSTVYDGRLNQKGRWRVCNLTTGHRIKVDLFGPRGALLGSKQTVVSAGINLVEFAANKSPDDAPSTRPDNTPPFDGGKKRPRFRRP
ncbi:MAG TPA: protein kinase [Blastocatellia bacterium]|nr:protein kinase [Blastocatellia bacterium]